MKNIITSNSVRFRDIADQSQAETIDTAAEKSKSKVEYNGYMTNAIVTGNLDEFIEAYNSQLD